MATMRTAFDNTLIVYTTATVGKKANAYSRLGLIRHESEPFKYDGEDSLPVSLLYFDSREASRRETILYRMTNRFEIHSVEVAFAQ